MRCQYAATGSECLRCPIRSLIPGFGFELTNEAKLLLANTLLREYMPGPGADNTLPSRARQQYLDVLAVDARNRQALQGLMLLDTNTKRFDEARAWALDVAGQVVRSEGEFSA